MQSERVSAVSSMPRRRPAMAAELKLANTCLFLDVDGTVLDIAARPPAIVLPPSLIDDLAAAEARLQGAMALVSGRPVSQLDQLFAPLRLPAPAAPAARPRFAPPTWPS